MSDDLAEIERNILALCKQIEDVHLGIGPSVNGESAGQPRRQRFEAYGETVEWRQKSLDAMLVSLRKLEMTSYVCERCSAPTGACLCRQGPLVIVSGCALSFPEYLKTHRLLVRETIVPSFWKRFFRRLLSLFPI